MAEQVHDVEIQGVTRRFGNFTAVDDISFGVPRGSFFSILGPSGCGKTTLLRMIAGFDAPTAGHIYIGGEQADHIPPNKRKTNMVFQNLALFPMKSVFENVAFGLRRRKTPKDEVNRKVNDMLERVGLAGYGGKEIHQLSGGQKQRVAIARAIVLDPTVLLLDEPLSALDLKLREHMKIELKKLQHSLGTTFIYITHDQGEALTMSDQIAIMVRGRVAQLGSPEELYSSPATAFVAAFVGDANRLHGTLTARAEGRATLQVDSLSMTGVLCEELGDQKDVLCFVRPQNIMLHAPEEKITDGYQSFRGVVRTAIFEGHWNSYLVDLTEHCQIRVVVPQASHSTRYKISDQVQVAWRSADAQCFSTRDLKDIDLSIGD